ncbi:translation initiation factor IF-5A [Candidatus Bathyarchaeota archaeon]|jgi:translation initiation factor 5A|nr:MAG: translation initiation factor IF-5A [Candidatus Bathyarchaeota archaeon]
MAFKMAKVGELKEGNYAIINDVPSQIVQITKSKPGKHGSAKFRCTAISLFDSRKQSYVASTDTNIQIPIVDKRSGQIVSVSPASIQLMDLESYEVIDVALPNDEEIAAKIEAGKEVEYWIVMDRVKIQRVKN